MLATAARRGPQKCARARVAHTFFWLLLASLFFRNLRIPFKTSTQQSFLAPRASQGRPKGRPRHSKPLPFPPWRLNGSGVWRFCFFLENCSPSFFFFFDFRSWRLLFHISLSRQRTCGPQKPPRRSSGSSQGLLKATLALQIKWCFAQETT